MSFRSRIFIVFVVLVFNSEILLLSLRTSCYYTFVCHRIIHSARVFSVVFSTF
jgi:hypothetical protein